MTSRAAPAGKGRTPMLLLSPKKEPKLAFEVGDIARLVCGGITVAGKVEGFQTLRFNPALATVADVPSLVAALPDLVGWYWADFFLAGAFWFGSPPPAEVEEWTAQRVWDGVLSPLSRWIGA